MPKHHHVKPSGLSVQQARDSKYDIIFARTVSRVVANISWASAFVLGAGALGLATDGSQGAWALFVGGLAATSAVTAGLATYKNRRCKKLLRDYYP